MNQCKVRLYNVVFAAAMKGDTRTVVDNAYKTNINLANEKHLTPLWVAANNGHTNTVMALVKQCHAEVDTPDSRNRTPVWAAARNGHTDTVLALVKKCNANCTEPDLDGLTPMYAAASRWHVDTVSALLRDCNVDPFETLKKAVYLNNENVLGILEHRCGVDFSIADGIVRENWYKISEHNEMLKNKAYECPVCLSYKNDLIAFKPCGHRVCTECWEKMENRGMHNCPKCRSNITEGVKQDSVTGGLYLYSRFFVDIPGVARCRV
jgi:hypothetical protein